MTPASAVMVLVVLEVDEKERVPIEEGDVFALVLVGVVDRLLHQDLCITAEGCRVAAQACVTPAELIWRAASLGELLEADDAGSLVVEGSQPSRAAARQTPVLTFVCPGGSTDRALDKLLVQMEDLFWVICGQGEVHRID